MPYTYDYPRPSVTVDCVIFGLDEGELKVLLIERDQPPFKGRWALPGGFVEMEEGLEQAARRELAEETGLSDVYLEQLYTFGDVGRDPRGRVISVAFYALLKLCGRPLAASSDARRAAWFGLSDLPSLAFDHDRILAAALERLKGKVRYQPIGFELLPSKFTLTQLQRVYETVLERELDKRIFRKKILSMGIVIELDEIQQDVAHRAARLYRFDDQRYRRLRKKGFNFEI
jgi:8-oxo-dGTP diphosphatase